MAEQSAISWTDATLSAERITPQICAVSQLVASYAKCDSISHIESKFGRFGEVSNVVGVEIPAAIVTAVHAVKVVTGEYIVSPSLQLGRQAQSSTLNSFAVDIARRVLASWSPLPSYFANFCSRFRRVLFPDPIAWSCKRRRAHFSAAGI